MSEKKEKKKVTKVALAEKLRRAEVEARKSLERTIGQDMGLIFIPK